MENKRISDRFQSFEEIPLYLDAKALVRTLGISLTTAYAMLSDPAFPAVKIGRKKLVRKEKLFEWLQAHETDVSQAKQSAFSRITSTKRKWGTF